MLVIFSDPFQGYILYAFLFFIFSCMAGLLKNQVNHVVGGGFI